MKQREIEYIILLLLGVFDNRMSLLHIQKEIFLMWRTHPNNAKFIHFLPNDSGPHSKELDEIIKNPVYIINCWKYIPPSDDDILSEGYIELTQKGQEKYQKVYATCIKNDKMLPLFAALIMVRELYDKLSFEEILLLFYDTYPEYCNKSSTYKEIYKSRHSIARELKNKGFITEERYQELIK
jgi:hypothetical protein